MSWWTRTTKRQRGWVKAHEAKENGKYARREEDKQMIEEQVNER